MTHTDQETVVNEKGTELTSEILQSLLENDSSNYPQDIKSNLEKYRNTLKELDDFNMILSNIESYKKETLNFDKEINELKIKVTTDKSLLYKNARELAETILSAYNNGEIHENQIIQPLIKINEEIKELNSEIEKLDKVTGFVAKTKAKALKAVIYGKLKAAEVKKNSRLKKVGNFIIENEKEEEFRTSFTCLSVDKTKSLREAYDNSCRDLEAKIDEKKKYWESIKPMLKLEQIESLKEILNQESKIKKEIPDYKQKLTDIEKNIIEIVVSDLDYKWNIDEIDTIINSRKEINNRISNTQLLSEKELDVLGEPKETCPYLTYISGIRCFDGKVNKPSFFSLSNSEIGIRPKGLHIKADKFQTAIFHENILRINFEDKEQIYEKKEKSVIGRSIVGLTVFGPLGAVIGGASGLKDGENKVAMPDLFLTITYKNENNNDNIALFSSVYNYKDKISAFFTINFIDKFQVAPDKDTISSVSEADEISKFKKLLDDGVITKEEFETKKKQILGL
ncbi:MAG: hypothetical protein GY795_27015 [Desulfobacterales bacterium]|nr:hypothetical protein [Desulfobacterales bacterium]